MNSLPKPAAPLVAYFVALVATLLLQTVPQAFADDNSFILSRNADYSTQDRSFEDGDSIYVLIKAAELDPASITDNRFLIHAMDGSVVWRGTLDNHLKGSFTTIIAARQYVAGVAEYVFTARLEDSAGNEFSVRAHIRIGRDTRPPEFFIKGEIEELGDDHLVVKGRKILVTADTRIFGPDGRPIDFRRLEKGHQVEVAAIQASSGLVAIVIRLVNDNEVHIGGPIQRLSVPDSVLVVQNIVVFVTSGTEISNADGATIEFGSLEVGQLVRVVGKRTEGGVTANTIVVVHISPPPRFELEGTVVEVTREGITIDIADIAFPVTTPHLFIAVNAETEIRDAAGNELGLGDISAGDRVKVRGTFNDTGTAVAGEIVVLGSLVGHIELKGPIAEVGDRRFRIGPFVFLVDEHTEFFDRAGQSISFADLEVGMTAKVFAQIQHGGSLLARRVHVESSDVLEIKIAGVISSIGERKFVLDMLNSRRISLPVAVTDDTRISDSHGSPLEFSDLVVGMHAAVKGHRSASGDALVASTVVVRRDGSPVQLVGPIQRIGDGAIVVGGVQFEVSADTEIVGSDGQPKMLSELTIGKLAKVSAARSASGSFVAIRIREIDAMFGFVRIEGTIDAVSDESITVLGKKVELLSRTRIDADLRPQPGAFARIEGELLAGGDVVALRVKIDDERSNAARVIGPIDRVANNGISVVGINFLFTSTTQFEGPDGTEIRPADITPGTFVKVDGNEEADGSLIARRVEVRRRIVIRGPITDSDGQSIVVIGRRINLGSETVVLNSDNVVVTSASLDGGTTVEVEAAESVDGTVALRVRLDPNARVVDVEEATAELPQALALRQNYPNPFNPSTTIVYEIESLGLSDVEVNVYDMLGRKVRRLFIGQVAPGIHTLSWDGRDDSGKDVASGAYLYRLRSGEKVESRQMLLLR